MSKDNADDHNDSLDKDGLDRLVEAFNENDGWHISIPPMNKRIWKVAYVTFPPTMHDGTLIFLFLYIFKT